MLYESDVLVDLWREAKRVVFFGGAGVSTESGVQDYRSAGGIYEQAEHAEAVLTPSFMHRYPEAFYRFCRKYFLVDGIEPNAAHRGLAKLEAAGRLSSIITQNIDGLHQQAGSRTVYELHGNTQSFSCTRCKKQFDVDYVLRSDLVAYCDRPGDDGVSVCGGLLRPDIVLYEEMLDTKVLEASVEEVSQADLLVVGGSSLQVWPAASLIDYLGSGKLVVINKGATNRDRQADLVIREPIGEVFAAVTDRILA